MYNLIIDSSAASLYLKSFTDRKKHNKDFAADLDDGAQTVKTRNEHSHDAGFSSQASGHPMLKRQLSLTRT